MRILFITDNFPPEVNAPATRTYEHCIEWVNQGIEVQVITCAPNFPHGKIYEGYHNKLYQKENINGVEVIRIWSYIAENSGVVKRILDYFSFALMAFFIGLFQKHDIIVATSPQFFTTWSAWGISKIRRKPWVFELRDLWPESILTVGAMKEGRMMSLLRKIEIGLYRDANRIIAVTDSFKNHLTHRGIDPEKISVITNGCNIELFSPRNKDQRLLNVLNLQGKFIVGYIGTHGMAHNLDFIVRSVSKIDDKNIHFLFIGDGSMKKKIVEMAIEDSLDNVTFLDPISKTEVPRYLSVVDVSLAPLLRSDTFKTVIPSKIFEASAMQIPTLLGVEGEAKHIIEQYHAGLCYEPENERDFLEKVSMLKNDLTLYDNCKAGCQELSKNFDRKILAIKMLEILKRCISRT